MSKRVIVRGTVYEIPEPKPAKKTAAKKRTRRREPGDKVEASELKIYIDNDYHLHMRRRPEFLKNQLKKMNAGKYDRKGAVKLWSYLAKEGADKYRKEFNMRGGFNPATREMVAVMLRDEFEEQVEDGEHDELKRSLMTKAQRKAAGLK